MKKITWLAIAALLLVFTGFSAYAADNGAESVAIVSKFGGAVQVYHVRGWMDLSVGMPVYEGDTFRTKENSFAELLFDNATIMRIDPNSELVISELKRDKLTARTIFKLLKGKVMAIVDKLKSPESAFEVRTKLAVAAVKGTELVVEADETSTSLGVYEGVVQYTNAAGTKSIRVEWGNQSWLTGSNNTPSVPEKLRQVLDVQKTLGAMREDVKVYRDMSRSGQNVREWLIKRTRTDEQGNVTGTSETNLSIGGTNAGHQAAVKTVRENIKNRLRNELLHTRQQAVDDLGFINEQMQADLHLGKTMTDVHGNRVRIEEYIFRPVANEVDLLSLTLRDTRMDYLRAMNMFNKDLPVEIPKNAWNNTWSAAAYPNGPEYYRTESTIRMSNMDDMVEMKNIFGSEITDLTDTIRHRSYVDKPVQSGAFWLLKDYEYSLSINDVVYEHKRNVLSQASSTFAYYKWVRMTDDKTFTDMTGVNDTIYEMAVSGNTAAQAEVYSQLDSNFNLAAGTLTSGNLSTTLTPLLVNKANLNDSSSRGYFNTGITLFNPGSSDLAVVGTRNYNDGTSLSATLYLINDYGEIKTIPTDLNDWISLIFDTNIELQLKSNRFADQDLGIDVVSKLLWWIALNPKNSQVYDDGSTTR